MPYLITFCGASQSGKTTLVESVIKELRSRGVNVAALKHHGHGGPIPPHDPPKDSERLAAAGAEPAAVVHAGGVELHLGPQAGQDPAALATRFCAGAACVVCEGFKGAAIDKIEVVAPGKEPMLPAGGRLLALARRGGGEFDAGLTVLDADRPDQVADFIVQHMEEAEPGPVVSLFMDGEPLAINEFVQTALAGALRGMVGSLKHAEKAGRAVIEVRID